MSQEIMKLTVDTGSVLVEINDKGEKIGSFRFNPNDLDIVRRYENVLKQLEEVKISDDANAEEILKVSDEIKNLMDYLLNYKVSDEIFCRCNPLSPTTNGDFYVENVLEGIAGLVEDTMNARLEKKKARIQKATAKYTK